MPPKSKFTREQVIDAALGITESAGFESVTARTLADALGSSPRPIFTLFSGMDEVCSAVVERAHEIYNGYVADGLKNDLAFKGVGINYIRFAAERPKLFALLFMREQGQTPPISDVLPVIDKNADKILRSVTDSYGLTDRQALRLYRNIWLFTHGIAVAIATKLCSFSDGQISEMLTEVFVPLLMQVKGEGEVYDNRG